MPPQPFVRTLRAQWLDQELRRLREARHMTLDLVAAHLKRDSSALSRYERGAWPIGRADVLALLDLYGFHQVGERERMLRLAEEVWVTDRWSENYSDILEPSFIDFPWLESRSQQVCSYHTMLVPGLFQLREYAELVIRHVERGHLSEEKIQRGVDLRMDRQELLTQPTGPLIDVVIDEAALRRPIGGPALMQAQLERVLECAVHPRVTVRVLPALVGLHSGVRGGDFWVFEMPMPYPAVAYLEYIGGQFYLESPKSDRYVRAYAELRTASLDPRESATFIAGLAKELQ
jgi:transcriptional regulator with XRE-family HTH domain